MFARTHRELRFATRLEPALWPVHVDRVQIEQVLLNLLVNAWQATPGDGEIVLETHNTPRDDGAGLPPDLAPGRWVRLTITDTGVGMDGATLAQIFDPFFTTRSLGHGTGLGLASAWGIVRNHGGLITAASEPGRGSTFTIDLPACDRPPLERPEVPPALGRGDETVLIIDDERAVRDVSGRMLEKLGFHVLAAASGREGLALLSGCGERVHLVLLDMVLPGEDSRELFCEVRRRSPGTKVLLCSGYSVDGEASEILAAGCDGFLQKPYRLAALSSKLREVLDLPTGAIAARDRPTRERG